MNDLIGKPFERFGRGPDGYDCVGLVLEIHRRAGHALADPLVDPDLADEQTAEADPSEIAPLDILHLATSGDLAGHAGVYLGGGRFVHAAPGLGVIEHAFHETAFRIVGARRWRGP